MSTKQSVKKTVSSPAATSKDATKGKAPPAAKKVAKKAAAPIVRQTYPADARVKVKRRNGEMAAGRVVECFTTKTGAFIKVNIGTKQVPIVVDFRPVAVKGY